MPTNVNSSKSTEMRHMRPYVHYHCPCPDLSRNDDGKEETKIIEISDVTTISTETETESTTTTTTTTTKTIINLPPLDINSPCIHFTTFNISKLYFCGDCHQIRCPNCVQEEIVCYYCPNCLFEVPTASVKSERNRCARNCFQCPICKNTLSVMASVEPTASTTQSSSMALISHSSSTSTSTTSTAVATTTASSSNPASDTTPSAAAVSGAPFYLLCSACRWDSQEIGLTFDKASGLALQLQNSEDEEEPDVKEFHHLREHFEKHLRHAVPPPTLQSALISIAGISSFSSRHGGGSATSGGSSQKSDDLAPYKPAIKVENESGLIDDLVQLKNINQIATLTQRMDQLSNQPYKVERLRPQRTHLRTKRIKRCRQCRHILIKPEQKAQETRFKIKLAALSYVPKITIASLPKLILNQTTQIVLKFSNPLYEDISLDLGVQDVEFGKIKILAPHFNVAPYSETWEYDDQDLIPLKSHSHMSATSALKSDVGIYERKNNSTSIILEITPEVEVEEFKFALLVTYTTSKTVDNNSESMVSLAIDTEFNDKESSNANIITPNAESSASNNNPAVESKTDNTDTKLSSSSSSSSSFDDSDQVMKSLSFWTVIGLGSVVKSGPSNKHMSIGSGGINDGSISLPHNSNTKPSTQK